MADVVNKSKNVIMKAAKVTAGLILARVAEQYIPENIPAGDVAVPAAAGIITTMFIDSNVGVGMVAGGIDNGIKRFF